MYTDGHLAGDVPRLPESLPEALAAFEQSDMLRERLGQEFSAAYLKLKRAQWREYNGHVSAWELEQTLDC